MAEANTAGVKEGKRPSLLADEINRYLATVTTNTCVWYETAADTYQGHYHNRQSLGRSQGNQYGVVIFAMPYINSYRVAVGGLNSGVTCVRVQNSGTIGFFGPIDCTLLSPNENVRVGMVPGEVYGFIEGTEEQQVEDGSLMFSDAIQQGTMVGLRKDKHYRTYLTSTADEGSCVDSSNHRPLDQLSGDAGFCFYTGLGLFLNANMLAMRASEVCGVWVGYGDWARLAGDPLQIWSGCSETVGGSEEGELYHYHGESLYPWETLGAFKDGVPVHRDVDPESAINKTPESTIEPKEMEQIPFRRYEEFGGYTGQGRIRQVSVPPLSASSSLHTAKSDLTPITTFRETISPAGAYAIASAREIIISKRNLLAPLKQKKLPNDLGDAADNLKNYKPSGTYGQGEEHKAGGVKFGGDNKVLSQILGIMDVHSHRFNWQALRTFRYHKLDYLVKQESALNGDIGKMRIKPSYAELKSKMWLQPPEAKSLYIDHIYKSIDIYEVFSHITLTDTGAVVIQANAGEELRLGGGGAVLGAPGCVIIQSGRTTSILAGDDAVVRANNSVDVTATKKDVRVKAEINLQMLGGNSRYGGGVLIESRSQEKTQKYPAEGGETIRSSGIVLKAPKSEIIGLSAGMYFKTGGKELDPGKIIFDVADGDDDLIVVARNVIQFAQPAGAFLNAFGLEKADNITEARNGQMLISNQVWVGGGLTVLGMGLFKSAVASVEGHFQSVSGGPVGRIVDISLYANYLETVSQGIATAKKDSEKKYKEYEIGYKYPDRPGHYETIRKMSFSLRDEKQYATEHFLLPEANWQQIADGEGMEAWREEIVRYQPNKDNTGGLELMPWPGKKAWSEQDNFIKIEPGAFEFYDPQKHHSKDTTAVNYGDVKTITPTKKSCQSDYKVIAMGD